MTDRIANVALLLLWPGLALIVFDFFGYTAAGLTLIAGWFIAAISEGGRR